MSAFIVSDNHINALVDVALRGPAGCSHWHHVHFAGIPVTTIHANKVGTDLLRENYVSVNCRYNEKDVAPKFRYNPNQRRISAVEALKAIACYEYQSCEHPEWESTAALKFCNELRKALIHALPGFDAAPWGID